MRSGPRRSRKAAPTNSSSSTAGTSGRPGKCPARQGWSAATVVVMLNSSIGQQPLQGAARQLADGVARQAADLAQRPRQEYRIDQPAQGAEDFVLAQLRRH